MSPPPRSWRRGYGVIFPKASVKTRRGEQLSRDPSVGERYFADPLVYTRTTLALGRNALKAGDWCRANLASLSRYRHWSPTGERTRRPDRGLRTARPRCGVERIVLPEFRHEILNEKSAGFLQHSLSAEWIELASTGSPLRPVPARTPARYRCGADPCRRVRVVAWRSSRLIPQNSDFTSSATHRQSRS